MVIEDNNPNLIPVIILILFICYVSVSLFIKFIQIKKEKKINQKTKE